MSDPPEVTRGAAAEPLNPQPDGTDERPQVYETVITGSNGRRVTLVTSSELATENAVQRIAGLAEHLAPATGVGEAMTNLDEVVASSVERLCALLAGHDALDIMAMLSQYLMPPDLSLWSESSTTGESSWAGAEVVILTLLGIGLPNRAPNCTVRTASIIPEVAQRAAHIVQLAELASHNTLAADGEGGINQLAWRLRSHETIVRGRQYASVARQINDAILRTPRATAAWRGQLGYVYDDVLATRAALVAIVEDLHEDVHSRIESGIEAVGSESAAELNLVAAAALRTLLETPSSMNLVTADVLAARADLESNLVRRVLDQFSIGSDGRTSQELVSAFVRGRNPIAGKAIVRGPGGTYLVLPGAIAPDEIRRTCEAAIKASTAWTRYGESRDTVVEKLCASLVRQLVHGRGELHTGLKYRAVTRSEREVDLSATSTTAGDAEIAEADILLVLDGVAVCVEVKAGDIRARSRQGGTSQLEGDLNKTIRDAAYQADRLRGLITSHTGLWLDDGSWLDLSQVDEVYTAVVCLDDLGPVALTMDQLVNSGALPQVHLPWIVSLHDLIVAAELLDRPEQFLTYLRRRTNRDAALWISASDELDVLMWFIKGGFYFEPDPDRLQAQHPQSRPPTDEDRRSYAEQGRTVVGTFTDELDAWYYWREGSSLAPAERPVREVATGLRAFVDRMREVQAPGWWRAAADLDGYSREAQNDLIKNMQLTVATTEGDGGFHTFATGGMDDTGRWIFIFATGPVTSDTVEHLRVYLMAKKHHDRSDRALGALIGSTGLPQVTMWLAHRPEDDPELDELSRRMGLVSFGQHPPDEL